MENILHITSGDCAGKNLSESGIPGEVFVWHDIMYDGPRHPGWPDPQTLAVRSQFLEDTTGGGLDQASVLKTLTHQYNVLSSADKYRSIVLWFDACLFDQSMLVHILTCLHHKGIEPITLICIDSFPSIEPYNGIGQLSPAQLAAQYDKRIRVTEEQFRFAQLVDGAFATQSRRIYNEILNTPNPPLPWVLAAVSRWLEEQPNPDTGLGRLEHLALSAVRAGKETLGEIFKAVADSDSLPQYWGDTTLWAKINGLARQNPPLVKITGPDTMLPQWKSPHDIKSFRVTPVQ